MSDATIARRYARAILELAEEADNVAGVQQELAAIAAQIDANQELSRVLANPQIGVPERKAILDEIAAKMGCSQLVRNFIGLLVDKRRFGVLAHIVEIIAKESDARRGVITAEVTSAAPLTATFVTQLTRALENRFKKKVTLLQKVDASLLAGVVTKVGDLVIDGSLRSNLEALERQLLTN
jgi:F-type H+-transporting ATPase subunit delta